MKNTFNSFILMLGVAMAIVACSQAKEKTESELDNAYESTPKDRPAMNDAEMVTVDLMSKSDSDLAGEATFTSVNDSTVKLEVKLENIKPGEHAVHLHEKGDCSAADGSSAGGHWNPFGVEHGNRKTDDTFHKGDIGNLLVGNDSTGTMTLEVGGWTIGGPDSTNVLNKAVIVHAGADDFTSQPSGAAGSRIGCGVIASN